ncbi:MAG TPA: Uma2 family endonuclease [Thermoanaerobaculia bacterium]
MQVSEEDFYSEEYEGSPYEYLGGELVVCEPVSTLHDDIGGFLYAVMRNVFEERGDGLVKGSRLPMRLDPKWSPEPDVMVVRTGSVHRIGTQRIEGPADLVIEVASPGDVRRALRRKLPRYREARIPEIWIVDPDARSVRVETLQETETAKTSELPETLAYHSRVVTAGRLDSAVFPGFWIDVSWLWRQPLPHTLACVRRILG